VKAVAENPKPGMLLRGTAENGRMIQQTKKRSCLWYAEPSVKYLLFYSMPCCAFPFDNGA